MRKLFQRNYSWAITLATILCLFTTYTLLDAFVFPKSYVHIGSASSPDENPAVETPADSDETAETKITENSYQDEHISIAIETVAESGVVYYVADIQLSAASYLHTAFADNTFGRNITQTTTEMAQENDAIFAINGDYYGFRDTGLVIRNGVQYRDVARSAPNNQALLIDNNGDFQIVTEGETSGTGLVEEGILQSFSFGPVLVEDGEVASTAIKNSQSNSSSGKKRGGTPGSIQGTNPRTAIGQISSLHYIVIVADGRSNESDGMTLTQLAQEFVKRGAAVAYNLDGGGSSAMWFNGNLINNPTNGRSGGERNISDIIYIKN